MGGHGTSPCASCKLLRRRCAKDCIFAPYFPSDDPHKFAIVHKVFGASNISKMLQELAIGQRADAVSSLVYEATARLRDPVYGCVGAISYLQNQVSQLQMQLAVAQAEILCSQMHPKDPTPENQIEVSNDSSNPSSYLHNSHHQHQYQYQHQHQHQYYNFTSSSDSVINQDSFKRESFFGHGIIS